MLRFHNGKDYLEIDIIRDDEVAAKGYGETRITIKIQSAGFSGHNDLWVHSGALTEFARALRELDRTRHGRAMLDSMSPGEMSIVVESITSGGHMAVQGRTGYRLRRDDRVFPHAVTFGFEFDPGQLPEALSVSWIQTALSAG